MYIRVHIYIYAGERGHLSPSHANDAARQWNASSKSEGTSKAECGEESAEKRVKKRGADVYRYRERRENRKKQKGTELEAAEVYKSALTKQYMNTCLRKYKSFIEISSRNTCNVIFNKNRHLKSSSITPASSCNFYRRKIKEFYKLFVLKCYMSNVIYEHNMNAHVSIPGA